MVSHRTGDEVRRNRRDCGIEIAGHRVVVAARVLDRVFNDGKLLLKIPESSRCLELRVRFNRYTQSAQRRRELALCLRARRGAGALRGDSSR